MRRFEALTWTYCSLFSFYFTNTLSCQFGLEPSSWCYRGFFGRIVRAMCMPPPMLSRGSQLDTCASQREHDQLCVFGLWLLMAKQREPVFKLSILYRPLCQLLSLWNQFKEVCIVLQILISRFFTKKMSFKFSSVMKPEKSPLYHSMNPR